MSGPTRTRPKRNLSTKQCWQAALSINFKNIQGFVDVGRIEEFLEPVSVSAAKSRINQTVAAVIYI
jgi:hypothetical protein